MASRLTWLSALAGTAGSLLVAYAAPRALADPVVGWWYVPSAPAGRSASLVLVYIGMAVLCAAWLGLGRALPGPRALFVIAGLWVVPLALAPPLFSRDLYSYLAQGTILHLGDNPYHTAPALLAAVGHRHVLDAVSPFWRHTTAPYGPLFLSLISLDRRRHRLTSRRRRPAHPADRTGSASPCWRCRSRGWPALWGPTRAARCGWRCSARWSRCSSSPPVTTIC